MGMAAGGLAAGAAAQGLKRMARGEAPDFRGALLSAPNARRLAERLARLRGAAMKIGQLVSMQGEDMLPAEFAQALSVLRSQAAPMPPQQLHRVLGREYGTGWERRFAAFDHEPVAAASIGQVHRVTTADGRDLALKIQYPGVARSIASDVDNVATLLRLFNLLPIDLDVAGIADEAKRQLMQEADYLSEAGFLEHFAKLVADEPMLLVPRVHRDLTTTRIMAMDFVEAAPLDVLATMPQGRRNAVGTLFERLLFRELFEFRVMQTDPNFANYLYQAEERAPGAARLRRDPALRRRVRGELRAHQPRRGRRRSRRRRARGRSRRLCGSGRFARAHRGGGRHVPAAV